MQNMMRVMGKKKTDCFLHEKELFLSYSSLSFLFSAQAGFNDEKSTHSSEILEK